MKMSSNKNYFTLLSITFLLVIISLTNISDAKKVKTFGSQAQMKKRIPNKTGLADGQNYGFISSCNSIKLDLKTFVLEAECKGKLANYSKISTLDLNKCFKKVKGTNKTFMQDFSFPGFTNFVKTDTCTFNGTVFTCEDNDSPKLYSIDLDDQIGNSDGVMNLQTCRAKFVKKINK
jgi:hypothetical protein